MKSAENESRKRIKECALTLFKERGFENVTIKDICEQAGCSNGTFYYHFGSMKGLLASYHGNRNILTTELFTEILSLSSPWEKLWRIHTQYINMALGFGPSLYYQFVLTIENYEQERRVFDMNEITQIIIPIVRQGQELGEIRNQTPAELLADTVGLTMSGVIYYWYANAGNIDLPSYMKTSLQNLYDLRPDLRA